MKQTLLQEKYPVFYLELDKTETTFTSVDEILAYLKEQVDEHKVVRYIATFDHYQHTKELEEHMIDDSILDAKNLIFCFGTALPNPNVLAVRPRSIGIVETATNFIITFMEAPMPIANQAMENWVLSLRNK
ncbi:MAG: hypothetical protein MI754_09435 [Chromatiales bacterium]|nr:hypothetical protein [Chromatiales bacterium]